MIENGIVDRLKTDTAVKAIVDARIYSLLAPQNAAKPHITYQRVGTDRDRHLQGPSGLVRGTFQLDCWASTMDAARALADAVRLRLDNFFGTLNNHEVQRIKLTNEMDNWEFQSSGGENIIGRVTHIYDVWYAEQVPA